MNNITVAGNLTRDAEKRFVPSGDAVVSFSVADNQGRDAQGNEKPPIYWNCSFFGKRADAVHQYLTKGQPVVVTGNVSEREWTDKEGNPRKTMDIRINDLQLMGGRQQGQHQEHEPVHAQPQQARSAVRPANAAAPASGTRKAAPAPAPMTQFEDDDIPF